VTYEPWFPLLLAAADLYIYVLVSASMMDRYTDRRPALPAVFLQPVARRSRWFAVVEIVIACLFLVPNELVMFAFLTVPEQPIITRVIALGQFVGFGLWTLYLIRPMRRPSGEG